MTPSRGTPPLVGGQQQVPTNDEQAHAWGFERVRDLETGVVRYGHGVDAREAEAAGHSEWLRWPEDA